jgi:hypothetical protein
MEGMLMAKKTVAKVSIKVPSKGKVGVSPGGPKKDKSIMKIK